MPDGFFNNENINHIIKEHLEDKIKPYGRIKYAYAIINKENPVNMMVITNYSEWADLYLKNSYQLVDPVIIKCLSSVDGFLWDEDIMLRAQFKLPMLYRMGENYDIKNGCTFTLHDYKNNLALLSIVMGEHCDEATKTAIINERDRLQSLLISTHKKTLSLYQDESDAALPDKRKLGPLTLRESEVIYLASQGKTYAEIACSLNIKVTTIKFLMGNIVKKLGAINAKHAIILGIELKLHPPALSDNSLVQKN
ncbi:LuxR family transcriptional regulator [Winslowiella iniecta]|uniref:HTH luxR-type domain-containing protein n=1 Tax=Winslowiella iniecta TaxID=1560201 RepID=A0A0L7SZC2_9GAMM|nr:LuxR family transcriptional regulator [Winslowiella iniecta]KOC88462.1 hypothetical protein NG42_16340 [Winslowiella iniecta]KOC91689.1 hypothetical protein NG43_15190 [Winslowiella iniecta]